MPKLKIPKSEKPVVAYFNAEQVQCFELTMIVGSDTYVLYKVIEDSLKKLGKNKNPLELEKKFKVLETMKGEI